MRPFLTPRLIHLYREIAKSEPKKARISADSSRRHEYKMELSVTPILKVGLEAESSVETDETTFDTPSHTFISRKLQKASPKRPESAQIRPDVTSINFPHNLHSQGRSR